MLISSSFATHHCQICSRKPTHAVNAACPVDRHKMLPLLLGKKTRDGHASAILANATHAACLKSSSKVNRPTTEAYFRKVQRLTARAMGHGTMHSYCESHSQAECTQENAERCYEIFAHRTMSDYVRKRRAMARHDDAGQSGLARVQRVSDDAHPTERAPTTACHRVQFFGFIKSDEHRLTLSAV